MQVKGLFGLNERKRHENELYVWRNGRIAPRILISLKSIATSMYHLSDNRILYNMFVCFM